MYHVNFRYASHQSLTYVMLMLLADDIWAKEIVFMLSLDSNLIIPSLLPTGSEERGVLGVGSIPVAILPSCQNMKTTA